MEALGIEPIQVIRGLNLAGRIISAPPRGATCAIGGRIAMLPQRLRCQCGMVELHSIAQTTEALHLSHQRDRQLWIAGVGIKSLTFSSDVIIDCNMEDLLYQPDRSLKDNQQAMLVGMGDGKPGRLQVL